MTEREKLIQLIKAGHEKASDYFHKEAMAILKQGKSYSSKDDRTKTFEEFVADTLIENGIGDIAEWKARAEVAERKYKIALIGYAKSHRKITHYNKMTTTYDREITQQAEKEIKEEKK